MIDSLAMRDSKVTGLSVLSDWESNSHSAELTTLSAAGEKAIYKLSGLTRYAIYEDFACHWVSHVKLLYLSSTVFLSLDPFDELSSFPDYENDNFWFEAKAVERLNALS